MRLLWMAIFTPQKHLTLRKELPAHPDYEFWDPKINFNSRLMDPIINLLNPVYILTCCFLKFHFNNIFPPTPRSPKGSLQVLHELSCIHSSLPLLH